MARLYVIFSGLLAFTLTESREKGGMVLLLKTEGGTASDGTAIPRHHARVRFRPREVQIGYRNPWDWDHERAIWSLEGEDIRFLPDGIEPCPGLKIENEQYLLDFKKILGDTKKTRIRRGCIGCNPREECLLDCIPALAGRARLSGGLLRPVDIQDERTVSCKVREELWGFRSLCNPEVKSKFLGEVANGLMFEMNIDDPEAFRLAIGDTRIPLFPDSAEDIIFKDCEDYDGDRLVVWVENLPATEGHSHDDDDLDRHFELLYGLLEYNVTERLVPYLKLRKTSDETDPPGSRCIPGAIMS